MRSRIPSLILLPLLSACWLQNFAVPEPSIPEQAPPRAIGDSGVPQAQADATRNMAGSQLADPSYLPPESISIDLPGGLRAITRTLFDQASTSAAYLKLTLPSPGPDRFGLPLLLAETTVSSRRSGTAESLRTAIRRLGGEVEVTADHLTTSILIMIPPERWHDALRRLVATMRSAQIERSTVEEIQRYQLAALRFTLSNSPTQALVDRLFDHRELGAQARYAALQDLDVSDVISAYGTGYSSEGSILSMVIPNLDAGIQQRQAGIILAAWTGQEIVESTPLQTPTLPSGIYWAPTSGDRSILVMLLELPQADGPSAAARLIALQALTANGIGGRLGHTLAQVFPHENGFRARRVERGGRQYLQLSTHIASSQVTAITLAFTRAARSLATQPPTADDLATAANRAIMRLLLDEQTPREWLASSTRRSLQAMELDTTVAQTLAALEHPTTLALSSAFADLAEAAPTWLVLGGRPPITDDSIGILEDNTFRPEAALVREASHALQITLATHMLLKTADALGGSNRILAIAGFSAKSMTTSNSGLRIDDQEWFDVSGRLRRTRKILATTIDTLIDGDAGDVKVEVDSKPLEKDACQNLMAETYRHPLLLIRAFLLGHDRYRLVATRSAGDRQMAILELIDPDRPRFRLHVDQHSGLLRVVERIVDLGDLGTEKILDRYRDYRNIAGIRVPFHRRTRHSQSGSESETIWEKFEFGEQEESVFQRDL